MKMIACVDRNWGIGYKGNVPVLIPADQKLLRKEIAGKVVVMGRKTLEGLPGGRPMDGCTNIVLSRKEDFTVRNATVVHSLEELFNAVKDFDPDDVYCIGGGEVYRELLPYADLAHITKIDHVYAADAFFPDLDSDSDWQITRDSEEQTYFDLEYRFLCYERVKA